MTTEIHLFTPKIMKSTKHNYELVKYSLDYLSVKSKLQYFKGIYKEGNFVHQPLVTL